MSEEFSNSESYCSPPAKKYARSDSKQEDEEYRRKKTKKHKKVGSPKKDSKKHSKRNKIPKVLLYLYFCN